MDPIQTIGKKLSKSGDHQRDAIHIAIMPAVAGEDYMRACARVKFVPGSKEVVRRAKNYNDPGIGIVDPYLTDSLSKGDKFWLFLHPNTVKGMRHHWYHPEVDDAKPVQNKSELWLRDFADRYGMDFSSMIATAKSGSEDDCITACGVDLHSSKDLDDGDLALFWEHMEAFTSIKFDADHRNRVGWSCSC